MTERDAENSDIIGAAVTGTDDSLRSQLVSHAQAGREMLERRIDVAVHTNAVFACNHHLTGIQILKTTLIFTIHVLRVINFPA